MIGYASKASHHMVRSEAQMFLGRPLGVAFSLIGLRHIMDALDSVVILGVLLLFAQVFPRLFLTNRLSLVVISIYLNQMTLDWF